MVEIQISSGVVVVVLIDGIRARVAVKRVCDSLHRSQSRRDPTGWSNCGQSGLAKEALRLRLSCRLRRRLRRCRLGRRRCRGRTLA